MSEQTLVLELPSPSQCVVYRAYDEEGMLLYIGATTNLYTRLNQHRHRSSWYPQIARLTAESCENQSKSYEVERLAIRSEHPIHNKDRA